MCTGGDGGIKCTWKLTHAHTNIHMEYWEIMGNAMMWLEILENFWKRKRDRIRLETKTTDQNMYKVGLCRRQFWVDSKWEWTNSRSRKRSWPNVKGKY